MKCSRILCRIFIGITILVALVVLVVGVVSQELNSNRENVIRSAYQLEWKLETIGNGFILCDADGRPLVGVTAYHVATDAYWRPIKTLKIRQYEDSLGEVEVFYHDSSTDVAFFRVPPNAKNCISFPEGVSSKKNVTFFGSLPSVVKFEGREIILWTLPYWGLWGQITSCCQDFNVFAADYIGFRWGNMAIANLVTSPGVSGSAVVSDDDYTLVGMVVGRYVQGNGALLVPADDIKAALQRAQNRAEGQPSYNPAKPKFKHSTMFALPQWSD